MKKNWPPLDERLEIIIQFIYGKSLQWAAEALGRDSNLQRFYDHDQWDRHDPMSTFAAIARKLGLPCDHTQNEQPWQVGKMWPLSIHSDASNSMIESIVNRGLYLIWAARAEELADSLPPDEALNLLELMANKLVHYFGSGNREHQTEEVKEWVTWLRCAHGCSDMASGSLTDEGREIAALREFNMKGEEA